MVPGKSQVGFREKDYLISGKTTVALCPPTSSTLQSHPPTFSLAPFFHLFALLCFPFRGAAGKPHLLSAPRLRVSA